MKERIQYIDGLKGVLILFVVYYHILWAAVKFRESATVDIFDTVCMQLFFMISGYLLGGVSDWEKVPLKKYLIAKVKNILIPTITMFVVSILYFQLDILYWMKVEFKNGYWFTYILFFFYVIHFFIYTFFKTIKEKRNVFELLFFIVIAMFSLLNSYTYKILNINILHFLSLQFVLKFYFFFLLGYVWRTHNSLFEKMLSNHFVTSILLILSFVPTHLISEGKIRVICLFVVSICRVVIIFKLFLKEKYFSDSSFVSRQICKIGRHSLEIYFLHYYFVFGIPTLLPILQSQKEMYVIRDGGAAFTLEFICIVPISFLISYLCIMLRSFTNFSPTLSKLFFGNIPKD